MPTPNESPNPLVARVAQMETEVRRIKRFGMGAALILGMVLGSLWKGKRDIRSGDLALVDESGRVQLRATAMAEGVEISLEGGTAGPAKAFLRIKDGKIEVVPVLP